MTAGQPRGLSPSEIKRMRAIVESGDMILADIARRFRCSAKRIRDLTDKYGWRNPHAERVKPKTEASRIVSRPAVIFHDTTDARRPAIPIDAARQNIASAAFARGVVVGTTTFKPLHAVDLMRAIRGAWDAVKEGDEQRRNRVEVIIRSIAGRLSLEGPVQVSPASLGVLRSFAGGTTGRRKRGKR